MASFICKQCGSNTGELTQLKGNISLALIVRFLGIVIPIRISYILVKLGIRRKAKTIRCGNCGTITSICPYCGNNNIYNDYKQQYCESCKKKYYNYV